MSFDSSEPEKPLQVCPIPPWPIAGKKVASELATLNPKDFPHITEWLARMKKFKKQLDHARNQREPS